MPLRISLMTLSQSPFVPKLTPPDVLSSTQSKTGKEKKEIGNHALQNMYLWADRGSALDAMTNVVTVVEMCKRACDDHIPACFVTKM